MTVNCDVCGKEIDIEEEHWVEFHPIEDDPQNLCWECYELGRDEWGLYHS